jgi:hypothetical protein
MIYLQMPYDLIDQRMFLGREFNVEIAEKKHEREFDTGEKIVTHIEHFIIIQDKRGIWHKLSHCALHVTTKDEYYRAVQLLQGNFSYVNSPNHIFQ